MSPESLVTIQLLCMHPPGYGMVQQCTVQAHCDSNVRGEHEHTDRQTDRQTYTQTTYGRSAGPERSGNPVDRRKNDDKMK